MNIALAGAVVGKGLLSGAIGDLYSFLRDSAHQEHLEQVLQDLDINSELDLVQALLQDLTKKNTHATEVAANQLRKVVDAILVEIKEIQDILDYHATKYFCYWRTPYYGNHFNNLRELNKRLIQKRTTLVQIMASC